MNAMKLLSIAIAFFLISSITGKALSEEKQVDAGIQQSTDSVEMTEGVVRKIDKNNNKITIKHGEIKNFDMPGMTMVFKVKHPDLLDMVRVGDNVKFRVEKSGSAFIVTDIQPERQAPEMHLKNR